MAWSKQDGCEPAAPGQVTREAQRDPYYHCVREPAGQFTTLTMDIHGKPIEKRINSRSRNLELPSA